MSFTETGYISQDGSLEEKDELHFAMFGINCPLWWGVTETAECTDLELRM